MASSDQYRRVLDHVAEVAIASGRSPKEITTLAVSKGYPFSHAEAIYKQGCRNFGENRLPEALDKMVRAASTHADMQWHFIGHLQSNKVAKVLGKFYLIHSVDTLSLATKISLSSQQAGLVTSILLQVNTSGEATKQGQSQAQWEEQIETLLHLPALSIQGLMTLAPFVEDTLAIRRCFSHLRQMRDRLQPLFLPHHPFQHLSMGMSNDYPIAIEEGATLLRIGHAIFN